MGADAEKTAEVSMFSPESIEKTLVASSGFAADAYDLFVINAVLLILKGIYPQSASDAAGVATAALVGAIAGQLIFGFLADRIGRRTVFIITITFVIVGALISAVCYDTPSYSIYTQLMLARGLLGFGIGGEYPLSATVTSEGATTAGRGKAIGAVFSMQGIGNISAAIVMYALVKSSSIPLDSVWRIGLALGAVPGLLTVYWRWKLEESSHYKRVTGDVDDGMGYDPRSKGEDGPPPTHKVNAVSAVLATIWAHSWTLAGTCGSWFLFDIVFYANGLFSTSVLKSVGQGGSSTAPASDRGNLELLTLGNIIIASMALPGYFVALALIDRMGRRAMQLMGFVLVGIIFIILGAAIRSLEASAPAAFLLLYGLTFFFANFGPNMSTFVIPAEAFPTKAKATCHGMSAASGKIGAAIGAAAMAPLLSIYGTSTDEKTQGLQLVVYICGGISILGAIWTLIFTAETRDVNVEELDRKEEARELEAREVGDRERLMN